MKSTDRKELADVINKYKGLIYSAVLAQVGLRSDADDVFQDVFLTYIRKAPEFESEPQRKAWLLKTAVNIARQYNHSSWNTKVDKTDEPLKDAQVSFKSSEKSEVFEAVMKLDDKYRLPVYFYYFLGLSSKEIGESLGITAENVDMRLSRARKMLRERLKGGHFDE